MQPDTHYARSGDIRIAYQVVGQGAFDLVYVPGFISNLDHVLGEPGAGAFPRAAGVVLPPHPLRQARHRALRPRSPASRRSRSGWTTCARSWTRSARERAAVFGISEGGAMSMLFAATYPGAHAGPGPLRHLRATVVSTTVGCRPRSSSAFLDAGRRHPGATGGEPRRLRAEPGAATSAAGSGGRASSASARARGGARADAA